MIFTLPIIAQIIGILAYAVTAYGFLHKDDNKFFVVMSICSLFWILHFSLLGGWTGVIANVLSTTRWLCARYIKPKRWRHTALFLLLVAYVAAAIFTTKHGYELIPLCGSAINTIGVFLLTGLKMRAMVLVSSMGWFTYAIFMGSIGGMLNEATMSTLNIITILRKHKLAAPPAAQH